MLEKLSCTYLLAALLESPVFFPLYFLVFSFSGFSGSFSSVVCTSRFSESISSLFSIYRRRNTTISSCNPLTSFCSPLTSFRSPSFSSWSFFSDSLSSLSSSLLLCNNLCMYSLSSSSSSNSFNRAVVFENLDHVLLRCSLTEASRWASKYLLSSYEEFNWIYWPNCDVKLGFFSKIYMSALKNWRCLIKLKNFCKYL